MEWLSSHRAALALALRRLADAPLNTLLSVLAIGIALALPAGGQMLLENAAQLAHGAAPQPQLSVFMKVDADAKTVGKVGGALGNHTGIRNTKPLPKEETLTRMKGSDSLREVIEVLGRNPFPDAFVVTPSDDAPAAMESLAAELRQLPGVEHVQLDSAWVRRLDALLRLGRTGVTVLALLLGAGLVAITFNIIRLQVLTLRAEIEVSRLLGATDAFIRRPFIHHGVLLGLLGALAAWLMVAAAVEWLRSPVMELADLYDLSVQFSRLGASETAVLIGIAGTLGGLGAAISLGQHLGKAD